MSVEWLYNPEGRTAWTIVPGLAGVVVMISMLMLGALTLVRERERGSWETLLATPVDAVDALAGKLSPYVIIGTVQATVVIGIARLLFNLPATGDLWALLIAVPLYSAAHLILGFAFSALAESQLQAIQGAVFSICRQCCCRASCFHFWECQVGRGISVKCCHSRILCGRRVGCSSKAQAPHWWHPR